MWKERGKDDPRHFEEFSSLAMARRTRPSDPTRLRSAIAPRQSPSSLRRSFVATGFGVVLLASAASSLAEPTWEVFQLTSGAHLDFAPHVSGTTYVWQRNTGGAAEIMMWSEGDPEPISIADTDDVYEPQIRGRKEITGRFEASLPT